MKTDLVLTMDEYFDQCCALAKPVRPPESDARHISITAGDESKRDVGVHGCRCDRWGHPCADCVNSMALYALLIEQCLRDAEWR
jgi:hypothetical protein